MNIDGIIDWYVLRGVGTAVGGVICDEFYGDVVDEVGVEPELKVVNKVLSIKISKIKSWGILVAVCIDVLI